MSKLKLGIFGSGFLGSIIADAWKNGLLDEYELVGIFGRNELKTEELAKKCDCKSCKSMSDLLALKPDFIAEAASVSGIKDNAVKILSSGCNLVVLSIGAFADNTFYENVQNVARENNTKVYIASGAVGGFDVLRTISLMGNAVSKFETKKGAHHFLNTPQFKDLVSLDESRQIFNGNAKEAIEILPWGVNVAVATALASTGAENTSVTINSVPGFIGDDHTLTCEINGVKAVVDIYSDTSAIAGWSVVSTLRNIVSPIVF